MLNEHLATLNQFISRSTDKCRPFFYVLKKMESISTRMRNVRRLSRD